MDKEPDLGLDALQRIARLWQVDADRVIWSEQGFDWWPGSFKVSLSVDRVPEGYDEEPGPAWRIVVRTELLRAVPLDDPKIRARIAALAVMAPTYAMVYAPPELSEKYPELADGTLWLQSTVYLRPDMVDWLPEFLGRMAILQPIDAQRQAEPLAEMLGGTPNVSAPEPGGSTDHRDDMLSVADTYYAPKGKEANRWAATDELAEFVERIGRNDGCFATGDKSGLTLETPFGENSSLIRLITNAPHPVLGTGLLALLLNPLSRTKAELVDECAWFNFFESTNWTGFPQFGSWTPQQHGEEWYPGMGFTVPNAVYLPGIATNAALWHMGRVRWVKRRFFPEMQDLTMMEILKTRWKRMGIQMPD